MLSSLALLAVMRRLNRDVTQAEAALRSGDVARLAGNHGSGPFGKAVASAAKGLQGGAGDQLFRWLRDWVAEGMFEGLEAE